MLETAIPDATPEEAPHTLLYVEDNPANLRLMERIIARRPGMRLHQAVSGVSGIDIALACRPTVILMDINLPDISGFKALKILRADPITAHIPVIALSANAMPMNVKSGLEAGFFRYLTKPIVLDELTSAMDKALAYADALALKRRSGAAAPRA